MIDFLRNFFAGNEAEKAVVNHGLKRERDVITLDAYAMSDDEEEQSGGCTPRGGGCGGCGCG